MEIIIINNIYFIDVFDFHQRVLVQRGLQVFDQLQVRSSGRPLVERIPQFVVIYVPQYLAQRHVPDSSRVHVPFGIFEYQEQPFLRGTQYYLHHKRLIWVGMALGHVRIGKGVGYTRDIIVRVPTYEKSSVYYTKFESGVAVFSVLITRRSYSNRWVTVLISTVYTLYTYLFSRNIIARDKFHFVETHWALRYTF